MHGAATTSGDFIMANDVALSVRHDPSPPLDDRSIHLRRLVVRTLDGGARGHVGSSLSLLEIMCGSFTTTSWTSWTRSVEPAWEDRDRCILSKGHGCIAQYVMLAEKGFFPHEVLDTFCRRDSILGGHPEAGKVPGVEASTGALGHGLPIGVGRAMGLRIKGSDARVLVITGDGEINEGSVWEAALSASKHRLGNLTVMIDYNKIQSAGQTDEILPLEPLADKWRAFGFAVAEVDGHDVAALRRAYCCRPAALDRDRPSSDHLPHGQGQGPLLCRARSGLASQIDHRQEKEFVGQMYGALGVTLMRVRSCVNKVFELAKRDPRVTYIGSDLDPPIVKRMKEEMPGRAFMEGVSEQHVVGMAAGLAMEGFIPFVHTIATFITRRCYEQVAIDLCLHNLPVRS